MRVTVLDLGLGNLASVAQALARAGGQAAISADPGAIARAERLVLPGQGAFRDCATALAGPAGDALRRFIESARPFLGICLGMQALFEESLEGGLHRGLGVLRGRVERIVPRPGEKVPHMGWNTVTPGVMGPVSASVAAGERFYFVHSYGAVTDEDVSLWCDYGERRLPAAVERGAVLACQFHPEKSQAAGVRLLEEWLRR